MVRRLLVAVGLRELIDGPVINSWGCPIRSLSEFPLFPLDLVALPHELIPLHIFEQRYKTMMNECIRNEREFGILWLADDGLRESDARVRSPRCSSSWRTAR